MRVDTGLQDGVRALRQDDQLIDLTLKVDSQEFRVHKVVLASVSDYFHAMLCGSLKESNSGMVELKEVSAEQMSRLLDFIYTGDNSILQSHPKEMLECGVYFQMPKVTNECIQTLTDSLDVSNCLELLSIFLKFGLNDTSQMVQKFMKANMKEIIARYKPEELSYECIQAIIKDWKNSEWELFEYLKSWLSVDFENRKDYMNDFFRQVRFKLMTSVEIMFVKETAEYESGSGSWRILVDKALAYHQLPTHKRVLDRSLQNQVRWGKDLFVMDTGPTSYDPPTYVLCKDKSKRNIWKSYDDAQPPKARRQYPYVIEVNNFLIACSDIDRQHWQIFDPRTLRWSKMAKLRVAMGEFALAHYGKHLYMFGGYVAAEIKIGMAFVNKYSFETNTWSCGKNMPVCKRNHAACVLGNRIYVSGGRIGTDAGDEVTDRMDSLDVSSETWSSNEPMLKAIEGHKMCVMDIKNKKSLVTIDQDLNMNYYDPETDQWSNCDFTVKSLTQHYHDPTDTCVKDIKDIRLRVESEIVARGNTLYLLKVRGLETSCQIADLLGLFGLSEQYAKRYRLCVKWRIPKDGDEILEFSMKDFPISGPVYEVESIAAMLAFPAHTKTAD